MAWTSRARAENVSAASSLIPPTSIAFPSGAPHRPQPAELLQLLMEEPVAEDTEPQLVLE